MIVLTELTSSDLRKRCETAAFFISTYAKDSLNCLVNACYEVIEVPSELFASRLHTGLFTSFVYDDLYDALRIQISSNILRTFSRTRRQCAKFGFLHYARQLKLTYIRRTPELPENNSMQPVCIGCVLLFTSQVGIR